MFKIEEDANAGFYLYAFEGGKCTHDYLQDTLALAKSSLAMNSAFRRTLGMLPRLPPNQPLQPTATRFAFRFSMTKTVQNFSLAPGSRG